MKKKISILVIVLMFTLTFFVSATDTISSGTCDDFVWTFDYSDSTLTINGEGELTEYVLAYINSELESDVKKIILGESITKIGEDAFSEYQALESIVINGDIESVGADAFYWCENLSEIIISGSIKTIDSDIFYGCENLNKLIIAGTVDTISEEAFCGHESLAELIITGTVNNIETCAFYECFNLFEVIISGTVETIGADAFTYCESLERVQIEGTVKTIEEYAFCDCESLFEIIISGTVETIEEDAFYQTQYYNDEENWDENVLYIGNYLIEVNADLRGSYAIKEGTKVIACSAFLGCRRITDITIPESVEIIGAGAFINTYITKFEVDDNNKNYTSVDGVLFSKDKKALIQYPQKKESGTYILPKEVEYIDPNAFYFIPELQSIEADADNLYFGSLDGVLFSKDKTVLVRYPSAKENEKYIIPDSVRTIGVGAFKGAGISEITIPDKVECIEEQAFYSCYALKSIVIPDSVIKMGDYAFSFCDVLKNITIGKGLNEISSGAFDGCYKLEKISIPDNITLIRPYAFTSCANLKYINFGNGIKAIEQRAFWDCMALEEIRLPGSIENISSYAFWECLNLKKVVFREGIKTIPGRAFIGCELLSEVVIPNSVETIEKYAFEGCYNLKTLKIGSGIKLIKFDAFCDCEKRADIYYNGTGEKWSGITIEDGNEFLSDAYMHYKDWTVDEYQLIKASVDPVDYIEGKLKGYVVFDFIYTDCDILVVVYDGDKITDIDIVKAYAYDRFTPFELSGEINKNYKIKVFFWNLQNLSPYTSLVETSVSTFE